MTDLLRPTVVRGGADARLHVSVSRSERSGAGRTTGQEWRADTTSEFRAAREKTSDEIFAQAVACYKAIKRHFMHRIASGHHTCVNSAARYLAWRLEGHTTEPFCPVAQAMLRWRCKWEGTAVPAHLLVHGEHKFLGILLWLSLLAPVGLPQWCRATDDWVILHVLAYACLDSFSCYLNEAANRASRPGPVWMLFPVVDFPEREWVVLNEDPKRRQVHLVSAPAYIGCAAQIWELQQPCKNHRQQHSFMLSRNAAPAEQPIPYRRRRATESDGACKSVDPLSVARQVSIGVIPMVLTVLAASDHE